jgi:hypothetical protein
MCMPVTPLHYPIAYLLHKLGSLQLSLPALIVGSFVPDLEVPFVWLYTQNQDRLVLHSFLGALTLGTAIAVALTVLVYPRFVGAIFPIDKAKAKEKCALSLSVIVSCTIGCLGHVLLDLVNHVSDPLFWPFLAPTASPFVPLLGGEVMASVVVHGLMGLIFAGLFLGLYFTERDTLWDRLLVE